MKQKSFKTVLIYPPPGDNLTNADAEAVSGDIQNIPYGLLSLSAVARHQGYDVEVLNLFTFPWAEISDMIKDRKADLYGISCFTSNRRGAVFMADLIRRHHPKSCIITGGPHATALPKEMLENCSAIDLVVTGEAEDTLLEIIAKLEQAERPTGIPGTFWRHRGKPVAGGIRKPVEKLDDLPNIFRYFNEYILITARGCPWDCTFCGSALMWGRQVRRHSAEAAAGMLETMVNRNGQKTVAIKDETFTHDKGYVRQFCNTILKRGLNFVWSCDTRADSLDEEILYWMRKAGCLRISIGVESAAQNILKNLNKKTEIETVKQATRLAKQFGFQIRFYMIVGSRGETLQTLQESLDFIEEVKPSQVVFNPFTVFPGTKEFDIAESKGLIRKEDFFTGDFPVWIPVAADESRRDIYNWICRHAGLHRVWDYTVSMLEETVNIFPDLPPVYVELAGAHYREGDRDKTEFFIEKALSMGYPLPGICYNYLACVAADRADYPKAVEYLLHAKKQGYHRVVENNLDTAKKWAMKIKQGINLPLELEADCGFEVTRPRQQPMTPGKIGA